jgi:hypothetical protein
MEKLREAVRLQSATVATLGRTVSNQQRALEGMREMQKLAESRVSDLERGHRVLAVGVFVVLVVAVVLGASGCAPRTDAAACECRADWGPTWVSDCAKERPFLECLDDCKRLRAWNRECVYEPR